MPSSHSQFLSFFSISLSLFLLIRHKPPPSRSQTGLFDAAYYHKPLTFLQRVLCSAFVLGLAAAVAWSRVYLEYHTPKQVLVGCAAGATIALVWFASTTYLRQAGWIDRGCRSWIGQAGRLRDLVVEEDIAEAGWQKWCKRVESQSTNGKTVSANGKNVKDKKRR